jgi:ABC-type nitrate/sulfonate/bicarbonate transport system substrate-binding protein
LLEKEHQGKLLANYGQYVTLYITHVIYASDALIAERPDTLRRFLRAWFATIDYMHANKDETVKIDMKADGITDADIARQTYDDVMPMFSRDGHFDPAALRSCRARGRAEGHGRAAIAPDRARHGAALYRGVFAGHAALMATRASGCIGRRHRGRGMAESFMRSRASLE